MPASDAEVLVGRHYLERGFLDAAMSLFVKNVALVTTEDWTRLADRLLERNRVPDVVRVCELGGVPLPRERMLQSGDLALRRRDVDSAMRIYELADADRERWARMVDVMTAIPNRARQAVEVVGRHLAPEPPAEETRRRHMKAVK